MKILITGGAGFIGSATIRYLIRHTDTHVVNVDKLTYAGNLEALRAVSASPRYGFERADISDMDHMTGLFYKHQPDAVMHLAAESHVDRSIAGPADFVQTNIVGTYTLLEVARAWWSALSTDKKEAFRFHHVSTDEVYGDLGHGNALFTETSPYAPSSPYSASKAGADHLVRAWHRTYGLPVVISNCSNNYGPWQYPEKLIPLTIRNALAGKPLPVYGNGTQVRDWLYVDDHARALYTVISRGRVGETYNIGAHNEQRNIDVVHKVCDILDRVRPRASGTHADLITFVHDRPGHDVRYAIDARKLQRELGWKPEVSFGPGLEKTVHWYLSHYQTASGASGDAMLP